MATFATLTGDKELDRQLSRLRSSVQNKLMRQAVLVSLRSVSKAMKGEVKTPNAKVTSRVKKSIGQRFKKLNKKTGKTEALVGVNVGKKKGSATRMPHAVFFLSSSGADRMRKSGGSTGRMTAPASGAIMRAWGQAEQPAYAKLKTTLRAGIEREARKK